MAQAAAQQRSKWGSSLTDVFNRFLEELFEHPLEGYDELLSSTRDP
jgi:hypothetical protein